MILDKIAERLLQPINTSVISILGMFSVFLGVWLTLPFDSLSNELIGNKHYYEWIVGTAMVIPGATIVIGALMDKMHALTIVTGLGFYVWFGLMVLTLILNWQSGWWIVALMIAIYCGFVHLNLRVNRNNLPNKNYSSKI